MKNLSLFFLFTILFWCSCTNPYENSFIEMNKTPCFGTCPEYDINIKGTGHASFTGKRFAKREGDYEKQLTVAECKALFMAFEDGNFWAFENEYTSNISDLPTTYLTFSHGGQQKKIKDYYGSPPELKTLEKLVEEIADAEGWTKVE